MLRLNNVQVIYSDVILVLKGLSLEVAEGQIVALLGANGAGKTTTLKAISGLLKTESGRVTDGSIEFTDRRIDGMDPEDICRRGIVQVMEGRKVLETLTVEENLRIGAYTRKDPEGVQRDLRMIYDYFPVLVARRRRQRSCSSSKTRRSRCASPTTATSWRTAASSSRARPPSCAATRTCASSTSA